jgi:hypothetical protein
MAGGFMTAVVMADCAGLWRRTLLIDPDGKRDVGTDVVWLQGITTYVDSRGFAGRVHQRGETFQWGRVIDLQPPSESPDAGNMRWEGATLIETGVHIAYVEHWKRAAVDRSPCWGLTTRDATGEEALLLRVGDLFGWACASGVHIGALDSAEWADLDVRLDGDRLWAAGTRWKVIHTEGVVYL